MVLQKDGVTDPVGIKLRPIETIHGIMYLDPGAITNALSYVFGPLVESLWDLGYDDTSLRAGPYDWRVPPCYLESRDGYFTKLKEKIDDMFESNNQKKVVIVAHSLGTRCTHYFLRFCERHFGRAWISEHIHTWVAVGPLFLGAPKSVRATISGERMGLEAFLFEDEGVLLSRGCGSSAWMFPYVTPDYSFDDYVYRKNESGEWIPQSMEEACAESEVTGIWNGYQTNYIDDPCFGSQEDQLKAPPVDKILAIYGINLKTENFYFYKESVNGLTKLELDTTGTMPNYVCSGGIAYETPDTPQPKLGGRKRSGDGTVPYPSLSYCSYWKSSVDVTIEELEGAEHREILKDKSFTRIILEYVCHAPLPPQLPDTFRNLVYDVLEIRDTRKANRKITLTQKGIQVHNRGNNTIFHKKYSAIKSVKDLGNNTFGIEFVRSNSHYIYYTLKSREIVQEVNVRIKFIEYSRPSAEETIDEQGQTDLHRAVKDNDIALVRELISDDRNVNAQDKDDWTPLHIATHENHIEVAILLLQHPKIDVTLKTKDSTTPLFYALRSNNDNCEELWDLFVKVGGDVTDRGKQGTTLLHEATMRLNTRAIKWLIKEFCNVNAKDDRGDTALHIAVHQNDRDVIALLLESGADRHLQNNSQKTALNYAQTISPELLTFLRDYKVSGYRARAEHAFRAENPEELSFADGDRINNIRITDEYGNGWWFGECNGKKGYFPSNYVKVSEQIRDESRPPLGAPEPEDGPKDVRDEYGQTPLHKAAFENRVEDVFGLVMDRTVNINAQDRNGWTPLHCAASQKSMEIVLMLIQRENIDLTKRSADGTTALHYLARIKPENSVEEGKLSNILGRVCRDVDVDILGKSGETPLHQSAMKGCLFVTKYLLSHQANANALSDNNTTPLFYAVGHHDIATVKELLSFKADPTIKSKRGTPIELAAHSNSSTILQLLEENKPADAQQTMQFRPVLPLRKSRRNNLHRFNSMIGQIRARGVTDPHSLLSQPTIEDISYGSSASEDDFEIIEDGDLVMTDSRTQTINDLLREEFEDNVKEFEQFILQWLLEKSYGGNSLEMRNAISSNLRKSDSGNAFVPIGRNRSSTPTGTQTPATPPSPTPPTASGTASSLLQSKGKKRSFLPSRSKKKHTES